MPSSGLAARRILMLGHCHSVFIHPMATWLKRKRALEISVLELLEPGAEVRGIAEPVFDHIRQRPADHIRPRLHAAVMELWRGTPRAERWDLVRRCVRAGTNARRTLRDEDWRRAVSRRWQPVLTGYDLYHFHYLHTALLDAMRSVPKDAPVVLSVWGSDLMDAAGVEAYAAHLEMCERANVITVRSLAMREILLSKFGRHLLPKIRIARFGIANRAAIDEASADDARASFCERHGIDASRSIVCLGHSGCARNRHAEVLAALAPHAGELNERATMIIPMTYGATPEYLEETRRAARESGLRFRILDRYMGSSEVAELRLATNVLVFVPEQDALSGAMCETLYAGNAVITGAWLPYSELWDAGVVVRRIPTITDLPMALEDTLRDADELRAELRCNKIRIRPLMDYECSIDSWLAAYDAAAEVRS
jgi:hypothetical protein